MPNKPWIRGGGAPRHTRVRQRSPGAAPHPPVRLCGGTMNNSIIQNHVYDIGTSIAIRHAIDARLEEIASRQPTISGGWGSV